MTLEQQETFLKSKGWGWFLEALALHRDALSKAESEAPYRDSIVATRSDYYAKAVGALADWASR
jgi:hypothetical protein